jgi:hypothetical protein
MAVAAQTAYAAKLAQVEIEAVAIQGASEPQQSSSRIAFQIPEQLPYSLPSGCLVQFVTADRFGEQGFIAVVPCVSRILGKGRTFRLDLKKAWRVDEPLNKYADESLIQPKGTPMLWTIIVILVILWLLGFIGHVGGSLIHLLLVIAVIVLIINLIQGRRGL